MKAAVYRRYGPPEVVRVMEAPKPEPDDDELLVRVRATSVNRTDCGFLRAHPFVVRLFAGLSRPRRTILGCEFAGDVEAVGSRVTDFSVGDRVFGFDDARWGGHADYKAVSARQMVATIPEGLGYEQAAVSTEGAHYALRYVRALGVGDGTKVLVHGATGAIGTAAVQLLKHAGAYVVATSTTANVEPCARSAPTSSSTGSGRTSRRWRSASTLSWTRWGRARSARAGVYYGTAASTLRPTSGRRPRTRCSRSPGRHCVC